MTKVIAIKLRRWFCSAKVCASRAKATEFARWELRRGCVTAPNLLSNLSRLCHLAYLEQAGCFRTNQIWRASHLVWRI
jgi:hypothetical protein